MNILKFILVCFLWVLIILLALFPGSAKAQRANLELLNPQVSPQGLSVDVEIQGLFDEDSLVSLRSGLPATLVFEWVVRWDRLGKTDPVLSSGELRHRVVFDVLEEEYFLFNHQGRPLGACDALAGVEETLCNQESLFLGEISGMEITGQYYIEMEVSLSVLSQKEVRGFENWLMGVEEDASSADDTGVSGVDVESSGFSSRLSKMALGVVKKVAGISSPVVKARSLTFSIGIED